MANLSYKLSSNLLGTTRIVNPGHLYPQDLNLMQEYQRDAFSSFCNQSIKPGIASSLNPAFNLEGSSLYTVVSGTQFTIKPGKAVFQDGVVFALDQTVTFDLGIPFSQDSSYILVLKKTETDTETRYNPEIQNEEVVERGWLFSFDIIPTGTFIPLSKLENSNMILLAQMLVDLTQQNYSILPSSDSTLQRPWFSLVDKEHRSKVGTGIISESNPHGQSINDLDGLPGLSYYEQQDLIGVISTYSGGPNHYGDLSRLYIPDAALINASTVTGSAISFSGSTLLTPTLTLQDASGFATSGSVLIGTQTFLYTNKNGNVLEGLELQGVPGVVVPHDVPTGAAVTASPDGYAVYAYSFDLPTGAAHILSVVDSEDTETDFVFKYDRSNRTVTIYSPTLKPWASGLYCNCLVIHAGLVKQRNGSGSVLEITPPSDGEYIVTPGGVVSSLQMTEYDLELLNGTLGTYDLMVDPSGMLYPDPYPLIQTSIFSIKNQPAMKEAFLQLASPLKIALTNFEMPVFTTDELTQPFLVLKISGKLNGVEQECTYNIYANSLPASAQTADNAKVVNCVFTCPAGTDLKEDNETISQWIVPYSTDSQPYWSYLRSITVDQASAKISIDTGIVIQYAIRDSNSIPLASFVLSKSGNLLSLSDIREQRIFFEKADGEILYESFHNPLNFNPVLTRFVGRGLEDGYWESKPLRLSEGTYRIAMVFDSFKDEVGSVKIYHRNHLSTSYSPISPNNSEITSNKKIFPLTIKYPEGYGFWDTWFTFRVETSKGTRAKAMWVLTTADLSDLSQYINLDHHHPMDRIDGLIPALTLKANAADVYNKTEVYNKSETYSRSEITTLIPDVSSFAAQLASKANQATTYTKTEVDGKFVLALNSPAFIGSPTAPTKPLGDNTTNIATTAFIQAALAALTSLVPTGTITAFAGEAAPAGYVNCDGGSYPTTGATAALFAVIGHSYGGSGSSFRVPDLKGRVPVGIGNSGTDGSTLHALGGQGGNEQGMYPHTHFLFNIDAQTDNTSGVPPITLSSNPALIANWACNPGGGGWTNAYQLGGSNTAATIGTSGPAMGAAPTVSDGMPPYTVVNYIIKL